MLAVGATGLVLAGSDAGPCPPGFMARSIEERGAAAQGPEQRYRAECVRTKRPESTAELLLAARSRDALRDTPIGTLKRGALASALREKRRLMQADSTIAGTAGTWEPAGSKPLVQDHPDYDEVNSLGLTDVAGRAGDFAYDPKTQTVYVSSNAGGVWASSDLGKSWTSVGESLPVQPVGSVGFSSADGGTIIALTGDSSFSGSAFSGVGAYRSTDGGKTWQRGAGSPSGTLGFRVAVDPKDPKKVYIATGTGLYRSTDAGRTYVDVKLPTGAGVGSGQPDCTGDSDKQGCALANMVTDVVVHRDGGRVVAAVGWRAGARANADGTIQSPNNGLYASDSGDPGSFEKIATQGLPVPGDELGRIEMASANGPDQDPDFLYAIVQDAVKFRAGTPVLDVNETTGPVPYPSNLSGVYASSDFGATWLPVATWQQLAAPGGGSALTPVGAVVSSYAPGVQAWYNLFIAVDPTKQVGGAPTRISFGLEEVWTTETSTQPVVGPTPVKVIGRYYGGTTCQMLVLPLPQCPTNRPPTQSTTTHPDQHGGLFLDQGDGNVSLLVANDGGVNVQSLSSGEELDNGRWGRGQVTGMYTLQPYDAQIAKDGTIYAGLQDNGEMKITPDGTQLGIYGGDGFYSAVDPDDSKIVYEEYVGGVMSRSRDGGRTWTSIDPGLTAAQFGTPFTMDPTDAKQIIVAGRDVKVTTDAPDGATWNTVFDLGTQEQPGVATASGINNQAVALDLHGPSAYVGYCGYCDVLTQGTPFRSGLATNVGGAEAPEKGTAKGWHIATAKGLPERHISSVALDPADPRTVYATLGNYGRRWSRPGVVSEDTSLLGKGHVFRSTDAGETFTDVSGNLPDAPAYKVLLRGGQLIVATEVGVFASRDTNGSEYALLGRGLPNTAALGLELDPDDANHLIAATHGRGVWSYRFKDPQVVEAPLACVAGAGLTRAVVKPRGRRLRFDFAKQVPEAVTVDLFQVSKGRRVLRERRVKRFTAKQAGFTFSGNGLRDAAYFARFTVLVRGRRDVRRVALIRRRGRFAVRKLFHRPESCSLIRSLKLERPVFGGSTNVPLRASYRLGNSARVAVTVTRGKRVVKRLRAVERGAGRTFRIAVPARRLPRGDYSVRFVIDPVGPGRTLRQTLVARRL